MPWLSGDFTGMTSSSRTASKVLVWEHSCPRSNQLAPNCQPNMLGEGVIASHAVWQSAYCCAVSMLFFKTAFGDKFVGVWL
eukprot:2132120-Amphidinium_carterae.2